jgi:glycosyltransferase involved in cell wall biosynthesis
MASHPHSSTAQICLVPRLAGLGGMVSFQARLVDGLARRGIAVSFDLDDPANTAVLVIGGTRHILSLWRARRRGLPIVQRLNGMNWLHRKQKTSLRRSLRAEVNNLLLAFIRRRLATRIVYQSQFSHDWWQRVYGPVNIPDEVVYNGVDLSAFNPAGPEQPPFTCYRLLIVEGHLGAENTQGLENAVRLVELLQARLHTSPGRGRPVELVVVGNVPADIRSRFAPHTGGSRFAPHTGGSRFAPHTMGSHDQSPASDATPALADDARGVEITWAGVLKREQIPAVDCSAHLLFSADLNAACPNAVIEALACGLPVVSFDTGALRELLQNDAGRVVPYGSDYWELQPPILAPLVEAASEILADNPRFRQAARARAEAAFGLERMLDGYLSALFAQPL